MKRIFSGLTVAIVTFFLGISLPVLSRLFAVPNESRTAEPIANAPRPDPPRKIAERGFLEQFPIEPSGYFFPVKRKSVEPETSIDLWRDEDEKQGWTGGIQTKYYYNAIRIKVSEKEFSFLTEKFKGVEYRFEGTFLKNGFEKEFLTNEKVLEGRLQKFKNGKKVLDVKTKFIYYTGC